MRDSGGGGSGETWSCPLCMGVIGRMRVMQIASSHYRKKTMNHLKLLATKIRRNGVIQSSIFLLIGTLWSIAIYRHGGVSGIQNFCYFWTGYATLGLLLVAMVNVSTIVRANAEVKYPAINFFFDVVDPTKINGPIVFSAKNTGQTAAKNLKIEPIKGRPFFEHIEGAVDKNSTYDIRHSLLLNEGVQNFAPGAQYNYYFLDSATSVNNNKSNGKIPLIKYDFQVSYTTYDDHFISYQDSVNLSDSFGTTSMENPIVNAIDSLSEQSYLVCKSLGEMRKAIEESGQKNIRYGAPLWRRKLLFYKDKRKAIGQELGALTHHYNSSFVNDASKKSIKAMIEARLSIKYHPIQKIRYLIRLMS